MRTDGPLVARGTRRYERFFEALKATGRPMFLSIENPELVAPWDARNVSNSRRGACRMLKVSLVHSTLQRSVLGKQRLSSGHVMETEAQL